MSAPIQASASVQVVPASNCVRSSTRIPARQPGDTGVTVIFGSLTEVGRRSEPYPIRLPPRPLCYEKPESHPLREAVEICELSASSARRAMSPLQFRRKPAVGVQSPETESLLEFALSDYERPRR